jgi:hypothetical protein
MTPDQILAFVLALTSPQPAAPAFPVIAAGGADGRYPVKAAPCPRPLAPFEIEGRTVICECAADTGCAAAYPNLKARFWSLYSQLAKAPIEGRIGKVDGEALVRLADRRNDYKNQAQGLTGYIPKRVAELEQR